MKILQEAYEAAMLAALAEKRISEADIDRVAGPSLERALPRIVASLTEKLKKNAPQMLREHRKLDAGFRRRNHRRWAGALDTLEMMWVIAHEAVVEFDSENRPRAVETQDYQFEALTHIHARALLVVREIICLLGGGFPDGALSRWRTLHELVVTALFLHKYDAETSERYLASFDFQALRAAKQINRYAEQAALESFSAEEVDLMKRRCAALTARLGAEMKEDYGWAAQKLKNKRPNFTDIEKEVKLEHWRPRYRWASLHTHSGHRPALSMLGTCESTEQVFLVGQSNSGFTDPIDMTALSLTQVTTALLSTKPNLDYLVFMQILYYLRIEIGPLAQNIENLTLSAARRTAPLTEPQS